MYELVGEHVFPFLRRLGGDESTYAHHMKDARFTIPTPGLLAKVVDMIDQVPMEERDTKGDLYEYMLAKIATAGQNGQFRTPRHIIRLMVEMVAPKPGDVLCDPACGTAGFLVAAGEYLRKHHPEMFRDAKLACHFHHECFHGFDFDNTMLRIGSMNMLLHGVENPDILARWRAISAIQNPKSKIQNDEVNRSRTAQSVCVPKADIAAQGYDLSLNRYKEVVHEEVAHRPPSEILMNLAALEKEIATGMKELEDMLR